MPRKYNPLLDEKLDYYETNAPGGGITNINISAGTTSQNLSAFTLSNSNNVSFGLNGSVITASASYPAQTAFVFSNSNGVTFGTNGSTVTASVNTNYQAPGAYLTTAALSNHSHNFATTTTNGASIIVGTTNSNGVTIGVPAFLTTAQPVGAYLTTARASNDAIGLNTAATNVTWTVNSNGISLNAGAYLTTAAQSNHSHGNPTLALTNLTGTTASASNGFTLSLSAAAPGAGGGAAISAGANSQNTGTVNFANSNGITFGLSNNGTLTASHNGLTSQTVQTQNMVSVQGSTGNISFNNANGITFGFNASTVTASHNGLTTAALSNHSHNFATTTTNGALIVVGTTNSNGATIGVPAYLTTAQAPGAYLTTARASNDGIGLNTAGTNVTWTVNSSGLSFNGAGYAGTGTSATNASITLNSNGLAISVAAPGGGGGAGTNTALNLTNLTGTLAVNTNGVSLSMSAANPGGGAAIANYWAIPPWGGNSHANLTNLTATAMTQRPFFMPFQVAGSLTAQLLKWVMSRATSGSNAFTVQAGVYSYANSTSIALMGSNQHVFSNTATASVSGIKQFQVTLGTNFSTFAPGQYFLGMNFSAAATASMNYSLMGVATGNFPNQTVVLAGTNSHITYTSNAIFPFWGRYSTTTNAMPAAVTYGQVISQTSSNFQMNFTLGQSV